MLEFEKNLENLLYATTSKDWINHLLSSTKSKDWLNHDVMFHMKVNLRRKTQSLCSNKVKKNVSHCLDLNLNGIRPGVTFMVILVHTSLVEANTTISCHFLWAEMEGSTYRAWPIQPNSQILRNCQIGTF